jgi:hypothetical protein
MASLASGMRDVVARASRGLGICIVCVWSTCGIFRQFIMNADSLFQELT